MFGSLIEKRGDQWRLRFEEKSLRTSLLLLGMGERWKVGGERKLREGELEIGSIRLI